jgi:WD40 repeat protein
VNIEFDHPTFVKWSPDSKAFIVHKFNENAIEVYKVEKKKDGWLGHSTKALTFPKAHETDVVGMGIASNGKYIISCSNKTDLVVWDLKGQILAQVDTYLMSTTCAKISPCGRFVVASGFAPDARVWEVVFNKSGEFQEVKRVFDLTGHSSGVYDVAFDADSSHMATVSKDGTWKLFDTKIEYKKGEDPHLKMTGKYQQAGAHSLIALSPNAEVVVIATGNSLAFYSALTGHHDYTIDNIYSGRITSVLFDAMGKYLLTTGDRFVRVFHNVTGYRCSVETAKDKLKQSQTSATKERLLKMIEDCEAFLETIEKK